MWTYDVPRRRLSLSSIALNLVLVLAIGAALLTWFRIANVLTHGAPVGAPSPATPSSFVWGNKVFSSQAQMAASLRSKGIDFSVWLRRHPDAARIINAQLAPSSRRPAKRRKAASTIIPRRAQKAVRHASRATDPQVPAVNGMREAASGSGSRSLVVSVLVALALVLGAFTIAPGRVWRIALRRVPMGLEERIYPAAGAAGILVALTVGFFFN